MAKPFEKNEKIVVLMIFWAKLAYFENLVKNDDFGDFWEIWPFSRKSRIFMCHLWVYHAPKPFFTNIFKKVYKISNRFHTFGSRIGLKLIDPRGSEVTYRNTPGHARHS